MRHIIWILVLVFVLGCSHEPAKPLPTPKFKVGDVVVHKANSNSGVIFCNPMWWGWEPQNGWWYDVRMVDNYGQLHNYSLGEFELVLGVDIPNEPFIKNQKIEHEDSVP